MRRSALAALMVFACCGFGDTDAANETALGASAEVVIRLSINDFEIAAPSPRIIFADDIFAVYGTITNRTGTTLWLFWPAPNRGYPREFHLVVRNAQGVIQQPGSIPPKTQPIPAYLADFPPAGAWQQIDPQGTMQVGDTLRFFGYELEPGFYSISAKLDDLPNLRVVSDTLNVTLSAKRNLLFRNSPIPPDLAR